MPSDNAPDDFESLIKWVALLWSKRGWDPHHTVIARLSDAVREWKKRKSTPTSTEETSMPNKGQSAREWLHSLEMEDENVALYMNLHRSRIHLKSGRLPVDDLDPATLLGLADVLVNARKNCRAALHNLHERLADPPIVFRDKFPGDVGFQWRPGEVNVISADEWPKTERSLVEHSKVIYFRDFLRSFWGRLTKRLLP